MLEFAELVVKCSTFLFALFLLLLALPKSRLRCVFLELCSWVSAALAAVYVISPLDVLPDFIPVLGWVDDAGAVVGGIAAVATALSARRDRQKLLN